VHELTGGRAQKVRLLPTQSGRVIFLTLEVSAQMALVDAHLLASELEEELRQRLAGIADVVLHTVPEAGIVEQP
jgi:divalent metal cation (Fe/Co/Zn/Cd) transporter